MYMQLIGNLYVKAWAVPIIFGALFAIVLLVVMLITNPAGIPIK